MTPLRFATLSVLLLLFASSANAQTTLIRALEFNDGLLPTELGGITFSSSNGAQQGPAQSEVFSVSDGYLKQRTYGIDGNMSYHSPNPQGSANFIDPTKGFTMETRLRVNRIESTTLQTAPPTFGAYFFGQDGLNGYGAFFTEDGIDVRTGSDIVSIPFDHSDFQTYRVTSPPNSSQMNLYADGNLLFSGPGNSETVSNFSWGDGRTPARNGADVDWDYLRVWQGDGPIAFPPPRPVLASYDGFNPISRPAFSNARNAIVLVHGWNDDPSLFYGGDGDSKLKTRLQQAIQDDLVDRGKSDEYDVITLDWAAHASDFFITDPLGIPRAPLPHVRRNAMLQGAFLARELVNNGYDGHVQLIAHSMGGRVIASASDALRNDEDWNGIIHETYLDAYTPGIWDDVFGKDATYAEHYFHDELGIFDAFLSDTDEDFDNAFNVDVTHLIESNDGNPFEDHKWPIRFYEQTVRNRSLPYGYRYSRIGRDSHEEWVDSLPPSDVTIDLSCEGDDCQFIRNSKNSVIRTTGQPIASTVVDQSSPSNVTPIPNGLQYVTASPVWTTSEIVVESQVDFLTFDLEFLTDSDGVLSVWVNGEQEFLVYEEFFLNDALATQRVELSTPLSAGVHFVSFRIDNDSSQTVANITRLQLGQVIAIPEPASFYLVALGSLCVATRSRRLLARNSNTLADPQ